MSSALYRKFCEYWGSYWGTDDPTPPDHWDIVIAHDHYMHMPEALRDEITNLSGFGKMIHHRMIMRQAYCP